MDNKIELIISTIENIVKLEQRADIKFTIGTTGKIWLYNRGNDGEFVIRLYSEKFIENVFTKKRTKHYDVWYSSPLWEGWKDRIREVIALNKQNN
jgi:hypothetical protein